LIEYCNDLIPENEPLKPKGSLNVTYSQLRKSPYLLTPAKLPTDNLADTSIISAESAYFMVIAPLKL